MNCNSSVSRDVGSCESCFVAKTSSVACYVPFQNVVSAHVLEDVLESVPTYFAGVCKYDDNILHRSLGPPHPAVLAKVCASLNITFKASDLIFCEACKVGKIHQITHVSVPTKTTKPLELITT